MRRRKGLLHQQFWPRGGPPDLRRSALRSLYRPLRGPALACGSRIALRGHRALAVVRDGDAEVGVGPVGGDPTPRRALYKAALQQVGLVDVLDGVARLAQCDGDGADAYGAA